MPNYFIDYNIIEELYLFCNRYHNIFICGEEEYCKNLKKYLEMADIVKPQIISLSKDLASSCDCDKGLIIVSKASDTSYYGFALKNYWSQNVLWINEKVSLQIGKTMKTLTKNDFIVELVLADHCDLNCQMCDHFSPLAKEQWISFKQCEKDIKRLAILSDGKIGALYLLGGEPLLNPELISIIKMVRSYFRETPISLYTNGIKLLDWESHPSGNLWKALKDNNIVVELTKYPISLNYELIKQKAIQYDLQLNIFTKAGDRNDINEKYSVKLKLDLEGIQKKFTFVQCTQRNNCHVLINGIMYTCPIIASINHFNEYFNKDLVITNKDYIDIYKVESFDDILEAMDVCPDFCKYCDLYHRTVHKWKPSTKSIDEWV